MMMMMMMMMMMSLSDCSTCSIKSIKNDFMVHRLLKSYMRRRKLNLTSSCRPSKITSGQYNNGIITLCWYKVNTNFNVILYLKECTEIEAKMNFYPCIFTSMNFIIIVFINFFIFTASWLHILNSGVSLVTNVFIRCPLNLVLEIAYKFYDYIFVTPVRDRRSTSLPSECGLQISPTLRKRLVHHIFVINSVITTATPMFSLRFSNFLISLNSNKTTLLA